MPRGAAGEGIVVQSRLERANMTILNAAPSGPGLGGRATSSTSRRKIPDTARRRARLTINDAQHRGGGQPAGRRQFLRCPPTGAHCAPVRKRGSVIGRLRAGARSSACSKPGAGDWMIAPARRTGGGLRYNGPADTLYSSSVPPIRDSGPVAVAAELSCQLADPCLQGVLKGNGMTGEELVNLWHQADRHGWSAAASPATGSKSISLPPRPARKRVAAKGYVSLSADG